MHVAAGNGWPVPAGSYPLNRGVALRAAYRPSTALLMSTVLTPGLAISRQRRRARATSFPASRMRPISRTDLSSGAFWTSRRSTTVSILRQTGVVPHDQVAIDLLDQVQAHAHGDEQAGPAVEGGDGRRDFQLGRRDRRDDGDHCQERGPDVGDPH